ncbi:hypothetical protein OH77DRAFT_1518886 [Trametes cingulata]|nr:hypothetical protein OH77DRAFT_1518886 [Trametes cingulata]
MQPTKRIKLDSDTILNLTCSSEFYNQAAPCPAPLRRDSTDQQRLIDLSLEAVAMIVSHLRPKDLYYLTRTCKALLKYFLSKTNRWMWDATMRNAPGIPMEPLSFLSIPAYAHLMYSQFCHLCGKSWVPRISGSCFKRICGKCIPDASVWYVQAAKQVRLIDGELSDVIFRHEYISASFQVLEGSLTDYVDENKNRILMAELDEFIARYNALGDTVTEESRRAFIEGVTKGRTQIKRCVILIERWFKERRFAELDAMKNQRVSDVFARLRQEGWGKEIDFMEDYEVKAISTHPRVLRAKKLSEAGECYWRKIMKMLRKPLERSRRLRLHFQLRDGLDIIEEGLYNHYRSMPRTAQVDCRPTFVDLAFMPDCRALLEHPTQPDSPFSELEAIIPSLADRWESQTRDQLSRYMRPYFPGLRADVDVLQLAAAVFPGVWPRCKHWQDPRAYALHYPGILRHPCLRSCLCTKRKVPASRTHSYEHAVTTHRAGDVRYNEREGSYLAREARRLAGQRPFDVGVLPNDISIGEQNIERMQAVLAKLGLDPTRATIEEAAACEARLRCLACESEHTYRIYDWLAAYEHTWKHYPAGQAENYASTLRRVERAEGVAVVRDLEALWHPLEDLDAEWCCALCPTFSANGWDMKIHLVQEHDIRRVRKAIKDGTMYLHPWKGHYHGQWLDIPPSLFVYVETDEEGGAVDGDVDEDYESSSDSGADFDSD